MVRRTRRQRNSKRTSRKYRRARQRGGTGPRNLLGKPLTLCSNDPLTGYARDGYCSQRPDDEGTHVVCAKVTDEFLKFTKSKGNNLSTPAPESNFPGLNDGDKWCLCALRWAEAEKAGKAPPIELSATHETALRFNPKELYQEYSL